MEILGVSTEAQAWELALLAVLSGIIGVLGGFVGLALGTIRLPILLLLGFPAPVAGGTNILVSTASAATGAVRHLRAGRIDWRVAAFMGIPATAGAFAGGLSSDRVSEDLLVGVAGALVLWQGMEFLFRAQLSRLNVTDRAERITPRRGALEGILGFTIGAVGGAVGLILGSIRLPAMIRVLHIEPRIAAGTNLFIGFWLGLAGFVGHGLRGEVDVPLLIAMAVTAMVGSWYGARLTGRVEIGVLIKVLGWVLAIVGAVLVGRAVA
jgi:uncharacterized membrane protein YfcA